MNAVGCHIACRCGGHATRLPDDEFFYVLTDENTIIFRGICNRCGEGVRVETPLMALIVRCPQNPNQLAN